MVQYVVDEIHLGFVGFPKIHAALCSKNTSMLASPPAKKLQWISQLSNICDLSSQRVAVVRFPRQ